MQGTATLSFLLVKSAFRVFLRLHRSNKINGCVTVLNSNFVQCLLPENILFPFLRSLVRLLHFIVFVSRVGNEKRAVKFRKL